MSCQSSQTVKLLDFTDFSEAFSYRLRALLIQSVKVQNFHDLLSVNMLLHEKKIKKREKFLGA